MATSSERELWQKKRQYSSQELQLAQKVLEEVRAGAEVRQVLRANPLPEGRGFLAKHALVAAYRRMVETGEWEEDPALLAKIRMKPIRTMSGVTTITILTKPHPCPGECIFCPSETGRQGKGQRRRCHLGSPQPALGSRLGILQRSMRG